MSGQILLEDESGVYVIAAISSIHPAPVKGEARDQTKVTAVHTVIASGGHRHSTAIPYGTAVKALREHYGAGTPAPDKQSA